MPKGEKLDTTFWHDFTQGGGTSIPLALIFPHFSDSASLLQKVQFRLP